MTTPAAYRTSRKVFPADAAGYANQIRCKSLTLLWVSEAEDAGFRVYAHRNDYDRVMRELRELLASAGLRAIERSARHRYAE